MSKSLPGTAQQQQIIQAILENYAGDNRILAVVLFGSLGRGNWDVYSDLDLDIVTKDDVSIDVAFELERLCNGIKMKHGLDALIIPYTDEGDVVLSNLVEFSIRYHALFDTKPAILDSMILLAGSLSVDELQAAGEANRVAQQSDLNNIVNQCLRYALELHNALLRQRLWMSLELLYRIRFLFMQLFTITHNGIRAVQFFDANPTLSLQERLKCLVSPPELSSIQVAFGEVIKLLQHDLDTLSNGQSQLSYQQQVILKHLNERG